MRNQWRAVRALPATPWTVLAALSTGGALVSATTALSDPDLPWHLVSGRQVLDTRSVSGLGSTWSFAVTHRDWTTTQWLSEIVLTTAHDVGGLRGVLALRLLVAAVLVVGLSRLLLGQAHRFWGPVVLTVTLIGLGPFLLERPQLASLPLLVWLSRRAWRALGTGEPPGLWPTVALTWFWANLHGLWVMVPLVLGLLSCCALLERRIGVARRIAVTAAACVGIACLTPAGPGLVLSPFRFAAATAHINEWQPTVPRSAGALVLDVVVVLFVMAWIRSRTPVPGAEVLYVGALVAFSLLAFRNVGPVLILLAPVLLDRLEGTFPITSQSDSERERRLLLATATGVLVAAVVVACVRVATIAPFAGLLPDRLARQVAGDGRPHRVLNDYNVGGILILRGQGRVKVAIDGRADYYGQSWIDSYLDLLALKPGWASRLARLDPDQALLLRDTPLTGQLMTAGWRETGRQGSYVLLERPDPTAR